jgi:DNA-binding NarL/FixJ family response regulator
VPTPLTDRESDVVLAVARGRTNAEIADDLRVSRSTVKTHLTSVQRKLVARNRTESPSGRGDRDWSTDERA